MDIDITFEDLSEIEKVGAKLCYACSWGRLDEVKQILADHPSLDLNDPTPWDDMIPLLDVCAWAGDYLEIVRLLLAHPDIDVNKKSNIKFTLLSYACSSGKMELVELLLKDKRVDSSRALWAASHGRRLDVIKWLIASGIKLDLDTKEEFFLDNFKEHTAIEVAEWHALGAGFRSCPRAPAVVSFLKKFKENPDEVRQEVRMELGQLNSYIPKGKEARASGVEEQSML